jgi:hypothetical protein
LFSIPKCGTHLLAKAIELTANIKLIDEIKAEKIINFGIPSNKNENQFSRCHMPFLKSLSEEILAKNYKVFFIYRDPRDQVVSRAYWIQKRQKNKQKIETLIDFLIADIKNYYHRFLPWKNEGHICTLKFEDLVGQLGGGNNQTQRMEIRKICRFLNMKPTPDLIKNCIKNLYGNTFTFREGKIGSWKHHFNAAQKQAFKKIGGQLLIDLEYEADLNW